MTFNGFSYTLSHVSGNEWSASATCDEEAIKGFSVMLNVSFEVCGNPSDYWITKATHDSSNLAISLREVIR